MPDYQIFAAGDIVLQSGLTYRGARLAYKTFGTLNAAKSNAIVYPTSYGAQHAAALRPRPLPAFHHDRQCPRPAAPAGGGVRHRDGASGLRLLDGRAAGIPLGRAVPRPSRAHSADLRLGQNLAA